MDNAFIIRRLLLQETGVYKQQWLRPYEADVSHTNLENLKSRIDTVTNGVGINKIPSTLISDIGQQMIHPSATAERPVTIVNGWDERKLRFILEIEHVMQLGSEYYYFQGYTDYVGISYGNHIDPDMVFRINSFARVNRRLDPVLGVYVDVITEASNLINGSYFIDNNYNQRVYTLRPEDLLLGVQNEWISSGFSADPLNTYHGIQDLSCIKNNKVERNSVHNNIPSKFLTKLINEYRFSQASADYGSGSEDILSRSISLLHETKPRENPFIMAISSLAGQMNVNYFTLRWLTQIDPDLEMRSNERIHYSPLADAVSVSTINMNTQEWNGSDLVTTIANNLIQSSTSIMMECMFVNLAFEWTNQTIDGQPYTRIISGNGFSTADMSMFFDMFIQRLNGEVMPGITQNGFIPLNFVFSGDLYGDTHIKIQVDNGYATDYVSPSFSSSLLLPVVTTNHDIYGQMVLASEDIINAFQSRPMQTLADTGFNSPYGYTGSI